MNVLVGCESSGVVREAFRALGHDAWSNDLLPADDNSPYHLQMDVFDAIKSRPDWDIGIFHPECTFLCSSGLHWNKKRPERPAQTESALDFVRRLMDCGIPKIAIENPIGCISTRIKTFDQIIQPYNFGHDASKRTCLWLTDLPLLVSTKEVPPLYGCSCGIKFALELGKYGCPNCNGEGKTRFVWGNQTPTGQNKLGPSETRWKERSRTYEGIGEAMAQQWSSQ